MLTIYLIYIKEISFDKNSIHTYIENKLNEKFNKTIKIH